MVEILDLERIIAHRAWPYERVMEEISALEARGEPGAWLRLLACNIYERPDEEQKALLDAVLEQPAPAYGRYSTLLAECARRPAVAARHLEALLGELGAIGRIARALRARGPSDEVPDVRALERRLLDLDAMVEARAAHANVERAARDLAAMAGGGAYLAPARERVLRSALCSGLPDEEVERALVAFLDVEVEPVRRIVVELDVCRARAGISALRLQDLIAELGALERLLPGALRLRSARYLHAGFPLHEDHALDHDE